MIRKVTKSEKETVSVGKDFAKKLKPGDKVFLYGDLGYGKTTLVKGIARGLEIKARIISPTFTIIREHKVKTKSSQEKKPGVGNAKGRITTQKQNVLYHIDLYRINDQKQLEEIGISEIIHDKSSIKLVEWPEKLGKIQRDWDIILNLENEQNTRSITIKHYG